MKNSIKYVKLAFFMSLVVFLPQSCYKDGTILPDSNYEIDLDSIYFGSQIHGEYLNFLINEKIKPNDFYSFINQRVNTMKDGEFELTEEEFLAFLENFGDYDYSEYMDYLLLEEIINYVMKEKLDELFNFIELKIIENENVSLEEIVVIILENEQQFKDASFLSTEEKTFLLTCAVVSRASLEFWAENVEDNFESRRKWWQIVFGVAAADAVGVGVGFLSTGNWFVGGIMGAAVSAEAAYVLIHDN